MAVSLSADTFVAAALSESNFAKTGTTIIDKRARTIIE